MPPSCLVARCQPSLPPPTLNCSNGSLCMANVNEWHPSRVTAVAHHLVHSSVSRVRHKAPNATLAFISYLSTFASSPLPQNLVCHRPAWPTDATCINTFRCKSPICHFQHFFFVVRANLLPTPFACPSGCHPARHLCSSCITNAPT